MYIRTRKLILLITFLIGINCCKNSSEFLIGKWQILAVIENDQSIELNGNWMYLKRNGTFDSHDGDLKRNESGKWTYDFKEKKIFIDAEGEEADSEWLLFMRNDTLFFYSTSDTSYLIAKRIE